MLTQENAYEFFRSMKLKSVLPNLNLVGSLSPLVLLTEHVKFGMLEILKKIKSHNPIFDLKSTTMADLDNYKNQFSLPEFKLLQSNVSDRDLLLEAKKNV